MQAIHDNPGFGLDDLKDLTASDMARVNQVITDHLASDIVLINQLSHHIILSGGKRLRPILVILAARACGYSGENDALLAAVVEFIHTATLLHDDVVDDSDMRRGQETASNIWGNEAAVLVGDYLYSRAFQMMVKAGSMDIMRLLADTTNTIAQGEVQQLLNVNDAETSEDNYLNVIYGKTACLFEAATHIGAILANSDAATRQGFLDYGRHLGIAFQLIDDALDYTSNADELGKNVGDDLAEGKPTLPLIYIMQHGSEAQRDLVRSAIEQGSAEQFQEIHLAIQQSGALEYTLDAARKHAELARRAIAGNPDSVSRQALLFLADYAVERRY